MKNWSRKTRFLIGGFFFAIVLTLTLLGFFIWKIKSFLSQPFPNQVKTIPASIREPKIVIGADLLDKTEFFKQTESSLGTIVFDAYKESDEVKREIAKNTQIAKGIYGYSDIRFDPQTGEIILLGKFGAQFFDRNGKLKKEITLEPEIKKTKILWIEHIEYNLDFSEFKIIDLENDGQPEFLAFDGLGGMSLFDNQGKKIFNLNKSNVVLSDVWDEEKWEKASKENPPVSAATAADLDGDKIAEIIYTTQNDEIIAVDRAGKEIWRQKSKIPGDRLRAFDLDNDSKDEIVELLFSKLRIRDSSGNQIREFEIDYDFNDEIFLQENKLRFFGISENNLKILDEEGNAVFSAEAPLSKVPRDFQAPKSTPINNGDGTISVADPMDNDNSEEARRSRSVWANLKKDEPKYLAAVGNYRSLDRAIFYVYSPEGKLLYHEILPEDCRGIIALPNENGSEDILLVGKGTVWRYHWK